MEDFCLDGREVPVEGRRLSSVQVTVLAECSGRSQFQVSSLHITGPECCTGSRSALEQACFLFLSVCAQFKYQGLCVVRLFNHNLKCFLVVFVLAAVFLCVYVCGWVNYPTHQPQRSHFRKGDCSRLCSRRFALDFFCVCVPVIWVLPLAALCFHFLGGDQMWTATTVLWFDFVVRCGQSGHLWHCKYVKNVAVWSFYRLLFSPSLVHSRFSSPRYKS